MSGLLRWSWRARRGRRLFGGGLLVAAGLGVWTSQASVHEARVTVLKEEIWRLEGEKAQIGAAATRRTLLEDELSRIETDLARLRPILPESFDVPSFGRGIEQRYGVEVLVVEERPAGTGAFESRDVSVVLFGDRDTTRKVPATGRFVGHLPLFWWKLEEEHDGDAEGVFTLFAQPRKTSEPRTPSVAEPVEGAWLWPYASREQALVARLEELRLDVKRDEALRRRVRLFEVRKAELAGCVDTINALVREPAESPAGP